MAGREQKSTTSASVERHEFGTFGGVFTPAILTILGVIMFMRAGFVVGNAGIYHALLILAISKAITFLTGLSIAAISTNTEVKGGGSYFLISRSLGPEFGGAIGLTLYLSQALAVPFYILGFAESVVLVFPGLQPYFLWLTVLTAAALLYVAYAGAEWAIRVEYGILALLAVSIVVFLSGAGLHFERSTFDTNWLPAYAAGYSFWRIFAIYFPAVTGIDAGLNMSGDLKDPSRSLPWGTLAAIVTGAAVYALQILLCGGGETRAALIEAPFATLVEQSPLHLGFLVVAGVFAATLSSAIGSFVGGPRILQALARDRIFPWLSPLAVGSAKGDEPRRALALTAAIVFAVLYLCGNDASGGPFNAVAAVISMFFLYSYGMINLAAFTEAFTGNPSFRPRFRLFHYATGLLGAAGCGMAALLINPLAAVGAMSVLGAIYAYIRHKELSVRFGDARRGFYYSRVRDMLLTLRAMPPDPKNWRPTIITLSGNPYQRHTLVHYASWLGGATGIVSLVELLQGKFEDVVNLRGTARRRLEEFIARHEVAAFADVVVGPDFDEALPVLLQSHSLSPLKPNVVMFGWPDDPDRFEPLVHHLRTATTLNMSLVILKDNGLPEAPHDERRVDLWWRGQGNGALMLILAHLLTENYEWRGAEVRLLRQVGDEEGREPATAALQEIADEARIDATAKVVVSVDPFSKVLHRYSSDATCVMIGFNVEMLEAPAEFRARYRELLDKMPTALLVCSSGEAELAA